MLYKISDERYAEISIFARKLLNSKLAKSEKKEDMIKYLYKRYEKQYLNPMEKRLFYLNLLIKSDKHLLYYVTYLYENNLGEVFDVKNMENVEPLEYYERYGYTDNCNHIIERFMHKFNFITEKDAYDKIKEVVQYFKAIKEIAKNKEIEDEEILIIPTYPEWTFDVPDEYKNKRTRN
jgi:hypothetical protein